MARKIVRVFVEGRVQGVGYRVFAAREAAQLGLLGWTRNRSDGRVETVIAGEADAIAAFVAAARRGPSAGRVDALHCEDADEAALGAGDGFVVAPTL